MNKLSVSMTQKEACLGWVYLGVFMFVLPNVLTCCNMLLPTPLPESRLNFLYFFINLISVVFIAHRFLWNSLLTGLKNPFRFLRTSLIGFGIYYCLTFLLSLLTALLRPDFVNLNDSSILAMSGEDFMLMSIGTVLLVPPVEEFLYRGIVFGRLYPKSKLAAYGVSTALFSAIHVMGYLGSYDAGLVALAFVQYVPAGILLAWAYVKADTIWAPVLIHITINQIGMQSLR